MAEACSAYLAWNGIFFDWFIYLAQQPPPPPSFPHYPIGVKVRPGHAQLKFSWRGLSKLTLIN